MSAPVQPRSSSHVAMATLRASVSSAYLSHFLLVATLLIASLTSFAVFMRNTPVHWKPLLALVCSLTFLVWTTLLARLPLLHGIAHRNRLPGMIPAIRRTLLQAVLLTVVLPGIVLMLAGEDPALAFTAPALAAAAGLMSGLLSPMLIMLALIAGALMQQLPAHMLDAALSPFADTLPLILLCASVSAWRWRCIARTHNPEAASRWRRPLVLNDPANASPQSAPRIPDWLMPGMRFASHAGRNPSATLSTVLAGPLGLTAPWRASGQWALALSAAVLALRIVPTDLSPAADTLLLLAVTPLLAAGWTLARRLHLQRQNMAASYVELALLPGLGSPESARVQLLRKAICRLAQLMLFPLVLIALMHWMRGFDPGRTALLLGIWSGACSGGALLCLIALSAPQLAGLRTALLMLPLVLATVASLVAAQMPIAINTTPALWVAAWLMVNAFHLGAGLLQLKRYRARAHPFLLD